MKNECKKKREKKSYREKWNVDAIFSLCQYSLWSSSGEPSFVHVYWIFVGFPLAIKLITIDSSSIPTAVDDGSGVNFGGTKHLTSSLLRGNIEKIEGNCNN